MITGDLDLDRVVWDAEYRRRVIDFLKSLEAPGRDRPDPAAAAPAEPEADAGDPADKAA